MASPSAFSEAGFATSLKARCDEVRGLYLEDGIPWVVGYSGGKDSSAVLQLVWLAIRELPAEQRTKPIHVITTDTLVEQPMVAAWVDTSQASMREAAQAQGLPITPHKLTPEIEDSARARERPRVRSEPPTEPGACADVAMPDRPLFT